jgi:hypothetical protein
MLLLRNRLLGTAKVMVLKKLLEIALSDVLQAHAGRSGRSTG